MNKSGWSGQGWQGGSNKYGAVRTETPDGIVHDSKGESRRWAVLQQASMAKLITGLQRQVRYDLVVNGVKVCTYVADFVYTTTKAYGPVQDVVEDFKGTVTPAARLKMKLFEAVHGKPVTVVKSPKAAFGAPDI